MLFFGSWSLFFVILVHKQNAQNPCIESETVVHNWNVTTLINNGWTQCYSYGFYTTGPNSTIEATLDSCPTEYDSYFFVGTLESLHSTNVILGAFGPSSVLSEYSRSKKTAFLPNVYNTTSYSVYWYNYPVYLASGIGAFGFSSIPEIWISIIYSGYQYTIIAGDTKDSFKNINNSEDRLSWSWLNGGYRVGNSMVNHFGNSIYNYKIIYYKQCETPPTPAPTAGSIKFTDTFGVLPFKNYGMIPALNYNDTFILLFGGSVYQQSLTKFDVENNKFENNNLYAFPEAIAMSSSQSYTQIDEDTIYIMSANNVFAIFDIMTQEITSHLFMSSEYRDGACLTHYNNYLIVSYLNVIQIYDTLNYFWISLDLIPDSIGLSSRRYHSCNVVGDYLYQIGGVLIKYYGSDQFRRTVEKSTSTVEKLYLGGMSENLFSKPTVLYLSNAKHATSSVVFQDKIIFVIGGRTLDSDYYYSDIDAIYTETDYIESYDVLEYKIAAAAVIIVGDILHVFGGSNSHNDTHDFAVNYYQYVNLATIVADEYGETDDTILYQLIPFIGSAIFIVTLCYIAFVCCRCGHSKQGDHKSAIEMASYSPTTGRASSAGNASLDTSYTKRGITLEFIISITLYVMDCIDGYTSIIVAEEYRKGPITPCTAGVGETYDFVFVATLIIIMTIVGFIFSTLDTIMYLQETCCWCEKNPQARIMNHIKIEIILNIFQDLAVSWLTMYIGLSVGHVSDAFVTSIYINCCVSLLYLIKNLMELWGMFGKIYKKFCTCCEGEHWDVRNAVINGCGSVKYISWTFILLSVATVATLMCLRYGGVETGNAAYNSNLVIDDVEYVDWVKYKGHYLTVPNLYDPTGNGHDTKDCYITCEDIMEDYGIVKCEVSELYEINGCSCTDTYIDIDECNTMICNGYSFEICYGTCSIN
eukprot:432356_1